MAAGLVIDATAKGAPNSPLAGWLRVRTRRRGGFERREATQRRLVSRSDRRAQVPTRGRRDRRPPQRWFMLPIPTSDVCRTRGFRPASGWPSSVVSVGVYAGVSNRLGRSVLKRLHQPAVSLMLLMLVGCLPTYSLYQNPPEQLSEVRSNIDTVGVLIDPVPPEFADVRPASGPWEGFKRGFLAGAGAPIVLGTLAPVPGSALLGYLVAIVTGPAGGVYGMFNYMPSERVDEATRTLEVAVIRIRALGLRESFAHQLVRLGNARTQRTFVEVSGDSPEQSVDTLLVVKSARAGLKGLYQIDPPSSAFLEIESRLVRVSDGAELLSARISCYGDRRTYLRWASNGGQALVDSLVRCVPLLAEKVIDDFFLVSSMPSD